MGLSIQLVKGYAKSLTRNFTDAIIGLTMSTLAILALAAHTLHAQADSAQTALPQTQAPQAETSQAITSTNTPQSTQKAHTIANSVDSMLDERVEIIDYKRNAIVGFMVLRNGNIIKQVFFKEPKKLSLDSADSILESNPESHSKNISQTHNTQNTAQSAPQASTKIQAKKDPQVESKSLQSISQSTQTTQPAQVKQEPRIPQTPKQNPNAIYEQQLSSTPADTTKRTFKAANTARVGSKPIPQEVGVESSRINSTYKNRQWDKKHIPHDIQTQVIDIQPK